MRSDRMIFLLEGSGTSATKKARTVNPASPDGLRGARTGGRETEEFPDQGAELDALAAGMGGAVGDQPAVEAGLGRAGDDRPPVARVGDEFLAGAEPAVFGCRAFA